MKYRRKLIYGVILAGYYTFLIIFSTGLGFFDVIGASFAITIFSYLLMLRYVSKKIDVISHGYTDLVVNVFVYSFISFFIAANTLIFSRTQFTLLKAVLLISPISVWTMIWIDFYLAKMTGKE